MLFAIAVGILAQTVPALSDDKNVLNNFLQESQKNRNVLSKAGAAPLKRNALVRELKVRSSLTTRAHTFNEGALKNLGAAPVECNPNSEKPDVGVLSCGDGKFCMESKGSSQGGFCMETADLQDHRLLQDVSFAQGYLCNASSQAYGTCDCDGFNAETGYGIVECADESNPNCVNACDDPICSEISFTYELKEGGVPTLAYHYDFFSPYSQNVTYTYIEKSCTIDFNGETCQTCDPQSYTDYATNVTTYCFNFDCTNTAGGHSGSNCASSGLPPVAKIGQTCQLFVCDLCPDGELTNLDGSIVSAEGEIPCSDIVDTVDEITALQCPVVQNLVADACGCIPGDDTDATDPPTEPEADTDPDDGPAGPAVPEEPPTDAPKEEAEGDGAHTLVNAMRGIQFTGISMAILAYFAA